MRKRTVASAISLALISVTTLVLAVFGSFDFYSQYSKRKADLLSSLQVSTEQLALSLALPIWNFQYEQAEKVVESLMLQQRVAGVLVTDMLTGRVLTQRLRDVDWRPSADASPPSGEGLLHKQAEVTFNDRRIATVDVWMTEKFLRQEMRSRLFAVVLQTLVVNLCIVSLLWVILNRRVVRPLKEVELYAVQVSCGQSDAVSLPSSPELVELDRLQSAINEMVAELQGRLLELRHTRDRIQSIMDSMPSLVIGIDGQERITHWNRTTELQTGLDAARLLGRPLAEALPQLAVYAADIRQAIERMEPVSRAGLRFGMLGADRICDLLVYPVRSQGVHWAVLRLDDVTEKSRIEQLIIQTEKMMSLGGLAAGMAHEINNPLAGILQSVQNIQRRLDPLRKVNIQAAQEYGMDMEQLAIFLESRQIPAFLQGIRESGERAARIVQNMLTFTRTTCQDRGSVNLGELADRVITIAATDYDLKKKYDFRHVKIVRDFEPDMPPVPCSAMEIEQVLLNLLRNAAHALALRNETSDPPRISLRIAREGDFALMSVEDNGPGMEKDVSRRVFEPFFTTKSPGEGTGLGLSVSYFIITRNHRGSIDLHTEPGKGSRFTVRLPLNEACTPSPPLEERTEA